MSADKCAEPLGWINEDELPPGYPYDAMFQYSRVDGVRVFPVFGPTQQPSAHYSIDADELGIRARVADTITGALAFGAQNTNPPPAGHWLTPFWEAARADSAAAMLQQPSAQKAPDARPCVCSTEDGATCTTQYGQGCLYGQQSASIDPLWKVLLEHSGCGYGRQANQLNVSLERGDKIVQIPAEAFRAAAKQPAAPTLRQVTDADVEYTAAKLYEHATDEPWTVAGVEHLIPDRDVYRDQARELIESFRARLIGA